jgi:hypothetical protein
LISNESVDLSSLVDRTTIGMMEGESFGLMGSSDREVTEILFSGPGLLFTQTSTGHQFFSSSPVFFYIGLTHTALVNPMLNIAMSTV